MTQLPLICLSKQLLRRQGDPIAIRQRLHNRLKFFPVRRSEKDRHAKAGSKRKLFLHRIIRMNIPVPRLLIVAEFFPDQMTAVRGRIDQDIIRLFFKSAFYDCF